MRKRMLSYANRAAIYNLYLYLASYVAPADGDTLQSVTTALQAAQAAGKWNSRDHLRLRVLSSAVEAGVVPSDAKISDQSRSKNGLNATVFTEPSGAIFVAFRGTADGEWLDNGKGLSGISETNVYSTYGVVRGDFATDQQVEALNWFHRIAVRNGWDELTDITVSGHSKGGNKAQFVALHSLLVSRGFSFDGQGFSPEAISAFQTRFGDTYADRIRRIYSISADNDYVNVLGNRLMPLANVVYLESARGLHYLEAMLDENGWFRPQTTQGELSKYIEMISREVMSLPPSLRQIVTIGLMNIFQQYIAKEPPVGADNMQTAQRIANLAVGITPLLQGVR